MILDPYIYGCTDESAFNYDEPQENVQEDVNSDDGSCYPFSMVVGL